MGKFQKPFVYNRSLLNPKAGDPDGFVSNDGMWAAIPWAGNTKGFCIIHNGRQVHSVRRINKHLLISKKNLKLKRKAHPHWRSFYERQATKTS